MAKPRDLEARVRAVVAAALELNLDPGELPLDEPLFDPGMGADSIGSLEIVYGLEREFGIQVEDDELRAELFESVRALCEFVRGKTAPPPAGEPSQEGACRPATGAVVRPAGAPG